MPFKDYIREIELIEKQNCVEHDFYSVIASVIRGRKNMKNLSLRDISNRNRTKKGNEKERFFWGVYGFCDFVILSEDYVGNEPCKEKVFGAIEAKYVGEKLQVIQKNIQLKGHILWFNKVIYTNGLIWEYYEFTPNKEQFHKEIEKLQNKTYTWGKDIKEDSEYKWSHEDMDLLNSLNELEPKWRISLTNGKTIDGNYNWENKSWRKLLRELSAIDWANSNL